MSDQGSAVIVGGTSGLGRQVAQVLAARGDDVVITGRDKAKSEAVAAQIGGRTRGLALDLTAPNEIAGRLAALYDYMQKRLLEANFKQIDAPLGEVLGLLTTLSEGWAGIQQAAPEAVAIGEPLAAAASPWSAPSLPEADGKYAQASWSL